MENNMGLLGELGNVVRVSARNVVYDNESDAVLNERINGIQKSTIAIKEAKVKDEKIIEMLQKHWDLRLSEAKEFLAETESANTDLL